MGFLNKNIISFEDKIFGLDLSDLSIKVVQIERGEKIDKVISFGSLDIPAGLIEDGRILDKEKVAEAIKEAVKKAGPNKINTRNVVCSLPESKVFFRIISIPKIKENEASEAIKWEMEANIPLPIEDVYFDWQFVEKDLITAPAGDSLAGKQDVLTVAVSREIAEEWVSVLEMADLEAYGLEVESLASARSLISKNVKQEETSLIVDLGAKLTSFIIIEGDVPYFTSSIHFSAQGINDSIAKAFNVSTKEAEKIKVEKGIENLKDDNAVFNAVAPLLENLIAEIEKTIDFYGEILKDKSASKIDKIILSGGGANLKGLVDYISQRLSKAVEIGDPLINFKSDGKLSVINTKDSARYSTAIGLAMSNLNYED